MSDTHRPAPPPSRHHLALMIWLCVFPTLTAINLALGEQLTTMAPVVRTLVLATIAVPVVVYGLMPQLNRVRVRLLSRAVAAADADPAASRFDRAAKRSI